MSRQRVRWITSGSGLCAAAVLLSACGHAESTAHPVATPGELPPQASIIGPQSGLDALSQDERQAALAGLKSVGRNTRSSDPDPAPRSGLEPAPKAEPPAVPELTDAKATPPSAPTPPPPLPAQIATKAGELRALLLQAQDGKEPLHDALSLAALDAFMGSNASPQTPALPPGLSPAEARVATEIGGMFGKLSTQSRGSPDSQRVAGLLSDAAESLAALSPVRIGYAGLCQRVDSFGRYEPFQSTAFLAGRTQKAVVYVELDRFTSRPPLSTDGPEARAATWVVEISQELELIHDADGRQQWYRPPQTVVDASKSRRHDFYLVNTIELPPTLSVGAYSLKVTIRDKASGSTDERVIPLQIIADPSATQSPRATTTLKPQTGSGTVSPK